MNSTKPPGRAQVLIVAALLALYGASAFEAAYLGRSWQPIPWALVVAVASFAVATRRSWARVLVYPISLLFVATWARQSWLAYSGGYFEHRPLQETALSLAPGALLVLLAMFCCYVTTVYIPWRQRRT